MCSVNKETGEPELFFIYRDMEWQEGLEQVSYGFEDFESCKKHYDSVYGKSKGDQKCRGCGIDLSDFSEYYQNENYCDDCI